MADDIQALATAYFEHLSEMEPTEAHLRGDYRYIDRFEDLSREARDADVAARWDFAARARLIDPNGLDAADLITRDTLIFDAETTAAIGEMRQEEFNVDPVLGMQTMLPVIVRQLSVETPDHAEAIVDKYAAIARAYDQATQRLREGITNGRTPAQFAVEKTVAQLDDQLAMPIDDDPLLDVQTPPTFSEDQTTAWKGRLATTVAEAIRPAMDRYRDVIRDEVGPAARPDDKAGVMWLPEGDVLYERTIRRWTTLPMQAEEIHQIGLRQIDRLADEYRELGVEVLGTADLAEIFSRLRDDSELHHATGEDVITASQAAFARAKAAMGDWFGDLPQTDCEVSETKAGPLAFYFEPADDGSRPGRFFMNTADPASWGKHEVEATSFHEGIPGHHLQVAIATELGDSVPAFRRHGYIGAYAEGWALYTERLADEMGLYGSQLDRMGMLSLDSLRSSRLVVDTGIHALGWSRRQAIDFMAENSPMSLHAIEEEVDRYISFPGQALSYMIGRLEIQRLRSDTEAALGERFDIKSFHDVVLGSGGMTLETLDRMVAAWVATDQARGGEGGI
jgi:uncharacterized protein (DUF885 family)